MIFTSEIDVIESHPSADVERLTDGLSELEGSQRDYSLVSPKRSIS